MFLVLQKTLLKARFSIGSSQTRKMGPKKCYMTRIALFYCPIKKNAGRLLIRNIKCGLWF